MNLNWWIELMDPATEQPVWVIMALAISVEADGDRTQIRFGSGFIYVAEKPRQILNALGVEPRKVVA
jgi:hypothetical protein